MGKFELKDTDIAAVKGFEGLRLTAYRDSGGVWTIGYGHTRGVRAGMTCTTAEADKWLREDLARAGEQVDALGVCKTQNEYAALTDFCYNLGIGNLRRSTLLRKIRAGAPIAEIKKEFLRWNKSGGVALKGLTKRRAWEAMRFAGEL